MKLGPEMRMTVTARLIAKGEDRPLTGKEYSVRLFDKDFFDDDFLGEDRPDQDGRIHISFDPAAFDRRDPIRETSLDFYFVVYQNDKPIFRSKVMEDVNTEAVETFKMGEGDIVDLGSFLI
jgi:hypothetical protein